MRFIDTNVFLRFLTADDPEKAVACRELLLRVDAGEEAMTSETVVAEVFYVLTRGGDGYALDRASLVDRFWPILAAKGLRLPAKGVVRRALAIYAQYPVLDFEDALSVAHMEAVGISEIVSYDRDFDRVAGIARVEP